MNSFPREMRVSIMTACLLVMACVAPDALATAEKFQPLTAIPGVTSGNPTLMSYINALFRVGIGLAALFAVIRITIAGIKYMGNDSFSSKSDAKEDIKEVLLGLLLILATVIILQTINPQILNLNNVLGPGGSSFQRTNPPAGGSQNNQPRWNTGSGVPTCPDGTPISTGGSCNGQMYVP